MANSGKFESLALLLASGTSIKSAAVQLGIGARTAYRIAASDKMKTRVASIRSEAVQGAVGRLSVIASQAVDTLAALLGPENDARDRLAAAKSILGVLVPLSEHAELRERLDAIERQSTLKVVS